jgi:nucleoside-diphosphate-sugar epimerase
MLNNKRTILITGASGYVGEMLCDQFAKRDDVEVIIALDKEPQSTFSKQIPKVIYIQYNLADLGWQNLVLPYMPDTIVHTAWQIRALYNNPKEQERWNVSGSKAVFDFAFNNRFVKKLIHFSTASSYSARADNTFNHYFTEAEGFRDDDYVYAYEKKVVEENLHETYEIAISNEQYCPQITVLRPASITGPRGRYMRIRFGLQSALQGNLRGGFINRVVTALTSFFPATGGWVRQFIHEDDVNDIVEHCVFSQNAWSYEIFNITPTGDPVYANDMAKAVGKKILPVHPQLIRFAFWIFWHLTQGRIPTCPGSWRFYSYPILMSGDKLTAIYRCRYSSKEAIEYTNGRYEEFVPPDNRHTALPTT